MGESAGGGRMAPIHFRWVKFSFLFFCFLLEVLDMTPSMDEHILCWQFCTFQVDL